MVFTIKPYGSLREVDVNFITIINNEYYLVDKVSNLFKISKSQFDILHSHNFDIKEVSRKRL